MTLKPWWSTAIVGAPSGVGWIITCEACANSTCSVCGHTPCPICLDACDECTERPLGEPYHACQFTACAEHRSAVVAAIHN
jgi:hypothetical protein